jgi:hypothetical protein
MMGIARRFGLSAGSLVSGNAIISLSFSQKARVFLFLTVISLIVSNHVPRVNRGALGGDFFSV